MNLGDNAASRWISPPHLQDPEQPSSSLIDRFNRLKTTYWNRGYGIVMLGIIGASITTVQLFLCYKFLGFMEQQNKVDFSHFGCISYKVDGYYIGLIPGGLLATIYPAHNILGIFVALSSIGHLLMIISVVCLNTFTHCILQFCIGTTMAVVDMSIDRLWTYWVPLNKQSMRHVPIVLYMLINDGGYLYDNIDKLHDAHSSITLTVFVGVIGLAWYVLWLYVINGNYSFRRMNLDFILFGGSNNSRYSFGTTGVSLTRSIVSDIPWKSICTSKPLLAIALLCVFDIRLLEPYDSDIHSEDLFEWNMRICTIILLLLYVVLVELVPEITVPVSTSNVRKFWSCSYFGAVGTVFILEAILGRTARTNKISKYFLKEMDYLNNFGFNLNVLDIAPKYASLIDSFLLSMHLTSILLWDNINRILSHKILNEAETAVLLAIICFAMAVFYAIFASAELQPWADEPVEENQQNMIENDNKS